MIAACPNVILKLGGANQDHRRPALSPFHHTNRPAGPMSSVELCDDLYEWFSYAINTLGPERCMFEVRPRVVPRPVPPAKTCLAALSGKLPDGSRGRKLPDHLEPVQAHRGAEGAGRGGQGAAVLRHGAQGVPAAGARREREALAIALQQWVAGATAPNETAQPFSLVVDRSTVDLRTFSGRILIQVRSRAVR